jgi:hypothetical protein
MAVISPIVGDSTWPSDVRTHAEDKHRNRTYTCEQGYKGQLIKGGLGDRYRICTDEGDILLGLRVTLSRVQPGHGWTLSGLSVGVKFPDSNVFQRVYAAVRRWLTPIILATQEVEIRRTKVQSQPRQIVWDTLS